LLSRKANGGTTIFHKLQSEKWTKTGAFFRINILNPGTMHRLPDIGRRIFFNYGKARPDCFFREDEGITDPVRSVSLSLKPVVLPASG
jgi:hypothetical protein